MVLVGKTAGACVLNSTIVSVVLVCVVFANTVSGRRV